jgi:aminoglycoside phosphotransferase (APT) family kinase protein
VQRFEFGERHAVYKVSYLLPAGGVNNLVVRISSSRDDRDRARAEREAKVLQKVQGFAAPLLYDFSCKNRWFDTPSMCMQFVPGEQRELVSATSRDIEHLGSVIGRVHALPADDLGEWFPDSTNNETYVDRRLESIFSKLQSVRDPLPVLLQRRMKRALRQVNERLETARSVESFEANEGLVLLHGDVAAGNIIWAPEPVLIDWEYARLGDPSDEVAYVFSQNILTTAQRKAFWRGYRRCMDPRRHLKHLVDRVGWWEPMTLLGSVLWWVDMWSRRADADTVGEVDPSVPRTQSYYLDQAIRRLNRFDELFATESDGLVRGDG